MAHILALDQGTTSSRAVVFDHGGNILALAQKELPQIYPRPGWVEHDPLVIWRDQLEVARQAIANARLRALDIAAIGITNQRETTVLWERSSGTPLANAIVWQDRRTSDECARLRAAGHEALIRAKTGLVLDPYFSATKLKWLLDTIPGARARAARGELAFGTVDSWLAWNLSGGRAHLSDISNASRTSLLDIHTGDWDEQLLRLFDIPRGLLPHVVRSCQHYADADPKHFGAAIPIAGMAGDQQAALFGQACHEHGMAKNTYGTGCFLLVHTGEQAITSSRGLITTCAAQIGERLAYALEGSVFIAGAAVQWLRDGLHLIDASSEIETLAGSVPDSDGVHFVPAFTGLGAPHWDAEARGAIFGLTRGTTAAHLARATLDAIALQSADLAGAMALDAGYPLASLRVDGGASGNDLLMQTQADILGVPVARPKVQETTALGAAYLAGLASGVWRDEAEIAAQWQVERVFEPRISRDEARQRMESWAQAVACARSWRG